MLLLIIDNNIGGMYMEKRFNKKYILIPIFLVVVVIAIAIIGNFVMNGITAIKGKDKPTSSVSEEIAENTEEASADTKNNQEEESSHWRFYWIDLRILIGGGGFCVIKILQEKKKAREKLQ